MAVYLKTDVQGCVPYAALPPEKPAGSESIRGILHRIRDKRLGDAGGRLAPIPANLINTPAVPVPMWLSNRGYPYLPTPQLAFPDPMASRELGRIDPAAGPTVRLRQTVG